MKRALLFFLLGVLAARAGQLALTWAYPQPMPATNTVFEVWRSTDLETWTLTFTTNQPPILISPTNTRQFFKARALDTNSGLYSDWSH
jgi:hypothetical protein